MDSAGRARPPHSHVGTRSGKHPQALGATSHGDGSVQPDLPALAPPAMSIFFGRSGGNDVLYEFRNGKRIDPSNSTQDAKTYQIKDSFGVSSYPRRTIERMFKDAELDPEESSGWTLFSALFLGEEQKTYEVGFEIVGIERARHGFDGRLTFKLYYVGPGDARRYGPIRELSGADAQNFFEEQRIIRSAEQTVGAITKVAIVMTEIGLQGGAGAVKQGIKEGAKSIAKEGGKAVIKKAAAKLGKSMAARSAFAKALKKLLKKLIEKTAALARVVGAAAKAFVTSLATALLKDVQGRPDVLKVACQQYTWPMTSVVGQTGSWTVQWQANLQQATIEGVGAAVESLVGDILNKKVEADLALDNEITRWMDGAVAAKLEDSEFKKEFRQLALKLVITDRVVGLVKNIGTAAAAANTREEFPEELRKAMFGDVIDIFTGALKEAVGKFKVD